MNVLLHRRLLTQIIGCPSSATRTQTADLCQMVPLSRCDCEAQKGIQLTRRLQRIERGQPAEASHRNYVRTRSRSRLDRGVCIEPAVALAPRGWFLGRCPSLGFMSSTLSV